MPRAIMTHILALSVFLAGESADICATEILILVPALSMVLVCESVGMRAMSNVDPCPGAIHHPRL